MQYVCMAMRGYVCVLLQEVADVSVAFPELWAELRLPPLIPPGAAFSSVLRLSSPGLQLWTHFDVMDNLLLQIRVRCAVVGTNACSHKLVAVFAVLQSQTTHRTVCDYRYIVVAASWGL